MASLNTIVQAAARVVTNADGNAVADFFKPPLTAKESEELRRGTEERYKGTFQLSGYAFMFLVLGVCVTLWLIFR